LGAEVLGVIGNALSKQQRHAQHEHGSSQIKMSISNNKSRKMKRYFRKVVIEALLVLCQPSIMGLLER
jgi:hypothetical protein